MSSTDRDQVLAELLELREQFREAHRLGMECLERGDFKGMADLAGVEREIIEEQSQLIERLRKLSERENR